MNVETMDFDLRYNDRVLGFHAYVNTDREADALGQHINRAARGPLLEAQACWLEGYHDGTLAWNAMLLERKVANSPVLQHGGRLLVFHVFVNTDRDPYHIQKAILRVARGPRMDACVVWSELYEGEHGRAIWGVIQKTTVKAFSDPTPRRSMLARSSASGTTRS